MWGQLIFMVHACLFLFLLVNSLQAYMFLVLVSWLTHWGRVTHICIGNLTTIGSDNGLLPGRCQAIIWTNAGILIGPLGTNFSEILLGILTFSFKKMCLKVWSVKWQPFCLCLNVVIFGAAIDSTMHIKPIDCDMATTIFVLPVGLNFFAIGIF